MRIYRLLEYSGPKEWIEEQIEHFGVKGTKSFDSQGCTIREITTFAHIPNGDFIKDEKGFGSF